MPFKATYSFDKGLKKDDAREGGGAEGCNDISDVKKPAGGRYHRFEPVEI